VQREHVIAPESGPVKVPVTVPVLNNDSLHVVPVVGPQWAPVPGPSLRKESEPHIQPTSMHWRPVGAPDSEPVGTWVTAPVLHGDTIHEVPLMGPGSVPVPRLPPEQELELHVGLTRPSSRVSTIPPVSPSPTPSLPSPRSSPHHRAFPIPNSIFKDISFYTELLHLQELAHPERIYLEQWQAEYPQLDPRTACDVPGDPISRCFAVLADAARPGHRNGQYVAPMVENVQGYFERAMCPLIQEIEECQEMMGYDERSIAEADDLMRALENGTL